MLKLILVIMIKWNIPYSLNDHKVSALFFHRYPKRRPGLALPDPSQIGEIKFEASFWSNEKTTKWIHYWYSYKCKWNLVSCYIYFFCIYLYFNFEHQRIFFRRFNFIHSRARGKIHWIAWYLGVRIERTNYNYKYEENLLGEINLLNRMIRWSLFTITIYYNSWISWYLPHYCF